VVAELPAIDLNARSATRLNDYPWQFYWKKLLSPEDFEEDAVKPDLVVQPVTIWNHQIIDGKALGSFGYGTYRLRCNLNARQTRGNENTCAAHKLPRVYERRAACEAGKVGKSADDYKPMRRSALLFLGPRATISIW
jgi:hypothetical protein